MDQQSKRWIQALGAVLGVFLFLGAERIYTGGILNAAGSELVAWNLVLDQLLRILVETVVVLALLALARLVSDRLLHGRCAIAVGVLLLLLAGYVDTWFETQNMYLGVQGFLWNLTNQTNDAAFPMIAGAWVLWGRRARPRTDLVTAAMPGVWDGGDSVLRFEPDGVFTLTRGGVSAESGLSGVAGLWEPGPDAQSEVVLKVDSSTDLGHGWQATRLDLELTGHTARLYCGSGMSYLRREPELVLEATGGYTGAVEVLEA